MFSSETKGHAIHLPDTLVLWEPGCWGFIVFFIQRYLALRLKLRDAQTASTIRKTRKNGNTQSIPLCFRPKQKASIHQTRSFFGDPVAGSSIFSSSSNTCE
jgi:hypothetical protein